MSMTMERPTTTWEARPGWGISVDLTPGEVVQARQVRVHQRLIGLALLVVLALCAGFVLVTLDERSAAEDAQSAAQARTTELTAETQKYAVLTTMQRVIDQVAAQVGALMSNDVDFVNLVARVRTALPPELQLTSATAVLSPADETAAQPGAAVAAGPRIIGSVTLAGEGDRIREVTPFVAALTRLRGVVDVVPTSVTQTETGILWTLKMNITDELYTHRFDVGGAQ